MTSELLAEEGLSIEGDFEGLMEEQRTRGRTGSVTLNVSGGGRIGAGGFGAMDGGAPTRFTGYETEEQRTTVVAVGPDELARPDEPAGGNGGSAGRSAGGGAAAGAR